jgi:hypothetical protein
MCDNLTVWKGDSSFYGTKSLVCYRVGTEI